MISAKVIVLGRVQGVGYRAFVSTLARDLRINGKVKNLPDGESVEIVCECGSEAEFEQFRKMLLRKDGLINAEKVEIVEKKKTAKPEFRWFYVDYG